MRMITTLLTIASLLTSMLAPAFAQSTPAGDPEAATKAIAENLAKRAKALDAVMKQFKGVCMDANGNVLENVAVFDQSTVGTEQAPLMCGDEALRLNAALDQLKKDQKAASTEGVQLAVSAMTAAEAACVNQQGQSGNIKTLQGVAGTLGTICADQSCPDGKPPEIFSEKCAEQAVCNAVRSSVPLIAPIATAVHSIAHEDFKSSFASCLGANGESNCVNELIAGILKDLWSNVTAVWDLAKLGGKYAWKGIKAGGREVKHLWHKVWGVEDKTSEAALAASQQGPGALAQFRAHPLEFMKQMAKQLVMMLWQWSKESFGCAKWSGVPHFSKCEKEMAGWDCASCDQKLNVVCGMAGLAGGEILVAYLTGGAASAGKFALKAGAEATAKFAEVVKAIRPIAAISEKMADIGDKVAIVGSKVAEIGTRAAEVVTKALEPATKAIEALAKTPTAIKIGEFARNAATKGGALALKAAGSAPVRITIKMLEGVTYPVRKYFELLNDAFKLGMRTMDRKMGTTFAKAAGLAGLDKVHDFYYALGVGEGGAANEARMLEGVKKTLTEQKISFREVTTPEGKQTLEVALPEGEACPIGKVTLGVGGP